MAQRRDSQGRRRGALIHRRDSFVHAPDYVLRTRDSFVHRRGSFVHAHDYVLRTPDSFVHARGSVVLRRDDARCREDYNLLQWDSACLPVQGAAHAEPRLLHDMGVNLGRFHAVVSQQVLHRADGSGAAS